MTSPNPTDAELVIAAITAYAGEGPGGPADVASALAHVRNDAEALYLAVGIAGFLLTKTPQPTEILRSIALEIARQAGDERDHPQ